MREGLDAGEGGFWSTLLWDGLQQRLLQVTIVLIININIINMITILMIIVCSNINCVHVPSGLGQTQATFDIAMGQVSSSWSQIYNFKYTIFKYLWHCHGPVHHACMPFLSQLLKILKYGQILSGCDIAQELGSRFRLENQNDNATRPGRIF